MEKDIPASWGFQKVDISQKCWFPRAATANDRNDFTGIHVQIDVGQNFVIAKGLF